MAAYFVFTRERTKDQSEMDAYTQKVGATLKGHSFTGLVHYGRLEVMEGPEVEGMVILSFPSVEAAKAWYDSPAYREVRKHRFLGADYSAVLVEGV
jgi:uncharacterized protein (DUF1330 family)